MNYRAAPLECGKTPSELLMGRNIRTRLPQLFRTKPDKEVKEKMYMLRKRQKENYDKGVKLLKPLERGDTVRISQEKGPAIKGQVVEAKTDRAYIVKNELDRTFRRNRNFLIKTNEDFQTQIDYDNLDIDDSLITESNINNYIDKSDIHEKNYIDNAITNNIDKHIQMEICNDISDNYDENNVREQSSNKQISRKSSRVKRIPKWTKDYQMNLVITMV